MNRPRGIHLGASHRRGITTTLAVVDEALCEFEQWALGREVRSGLYEERNTLTADQRETILAEVARVRRLLDDLKARLGLTPSSRDAAQAIWGCASGLREHLIELESKHLRRYGAVSTDLAAFIDPRIATLLQCIERIVSAVSPSAAADAEE